MSCDREVLERVRRIESRVTALSHKLGFATRAKKPVLSGDVLDLQSMETAFDEILAAIPAAGGDRAITIRHGGIAIAELSLLIQEK